MKYCDTSKVTIGRTTKDVVYDMVINKHYAGRWTGRPGGTSRPKN